MIPKLTDGLFKRQRPHGPSVRCCKRSGTLSSSRDLGHRGLYFYFYWNRGLLTRKDEFLKEKLTTLSR